MNRIFVTLGAAGVLGLMGCACASAAERTGSARTITLASSAATMPETTGQGVIEAKTESVAGGACARKVKVVYAGYGEADRAGCTLAPSPSAK